MNLKVNHEYKSITLYGEFNDTLDGVVELENLLNAISAFNQSGHYLWLVLKDLTITEKSAWRDIGLLLCDQKSFKSLEWGKVTCIDNKNNEDASEAFFELLNTNSHNINSFYLNQGEINISRPQFRRFCYEKITYLGFEVCNFFDGYSLLTITQANEFLMGFTRLEVIELRYLGARYDFNQLIANNKETLEEIYFGVGMPSSCLKNISALAECKKMKFLNLDPIKNEFFVMQPYWPNLVELNLRYQTIMPTTLFNAVAKNILSDKCVLEHLHIEQSSRKNNAFFGNVTSICSALINNTSVHELILKQQHPNFSVDMGVLYEMLKTNKTLQKITIDLSSELCNQTDILESLANNTSLTHVQLFHHQPTFDQGLVSSILQCNTTLQEFKSAAHGSHDSFDVITSRNRALAPTYFEQLVKNIPPCDFKEKRSR